MSFAGLALLAAQPPDAPRILATSALRFEPAADGRHFVARGLHSQFLFESKVAQFQANGKTLRLEFAGADRHAGMQGIDRLRSTTNVFVGHDASRWRSAVPNYARLQIHEAYPGIDLVYYGTAGELEYDLLVQPGADPRRIRLRFSGDRVQLDQDGNLQGAFTLKRPVAYQKGANGEKIFVASRFHANPDGSYGIALGQYDRRRELVIDPVLTLSQYIAGSSQDIAYAIRHDSSGFLYVAGTTYSSDFPAMGDNANTTPPNGANLYLVKIDPNAAPGSQIVFASFIGGGGDETFGGMAVDSRGNVFLTGTTNSADFPTANAAQSALSGPTDAFVMQLDVFQTIVYSTYLGGADKDFGTAIALDSQGRIWVTGATASDDFPNVNAFQAARSGSQDAFVAGIDPSLSGTSTIIFSSYLGGTGWDTGRGIASAPDGKLWVVGGTYSGDFPVAGPSIQTIKFSGADAFVSQIDPSAGANALVYSTYIGGDDLEEARNVVVDASGRAVVSGYTLSKNFPVTSDALQSQYGGNTDVFISILNSGTAPTRPGQLVYSTYFGGANPDAPFDLNIDSSGSLYVAGLTMSSNLPATNNALQANYDLTMDAFALKLNPSQSGPAAIQYFSYLGSAGLQIAYGIDFDKAGNIYLAGYTSGPIFDLLGGPGKGTDPGNPDAFVIGFSTAAVNSTQ